MYNIPMNIKSYKDKLILNSRMRWPFPVTPFPRILRQVSKHCRKYEAEIEKFDPVDCFWLGDEEEMSSIENYPEFLEALESSDGPGYPDYVAVSFVNDQVNYGVFATRDIPKGEFIGIYSGELGFGNYHEKEESSYLFELLDDIVYVEAKNSGNFTRFINHTSSENGNVESLLYLIETTQFGRVFMIPIVILYACQPILAGEQLLYDYGKEYWNDIGIQPKAITPRTYTLN